MRVTNQLISNRFLSNLNAIQERMDRTTQQMTTGRRFQTPEDDPVGAYRSLRISSVLAGVDQYLRNANDAEGVLRVSETYVYQAIQDIHRFRDIVVQMNNDTLSDNDRASSLQELHEIVDDLMDLANANYAGRYLFAGQKTDMKPYTVDTMTGDVVYNGDANHITFEVDDGVRISVNSPGPSVFGNLFADLKQTITNIQNGEKLDPDLTTIDQHLDHLIFSQANIGARMARVKMSVERLDQVRLSFEKLQTENEQIDLAEAILRQKMDETTLRAALAAGSRVLQPSLVDFLA